MKQKTPIAVIFKGLHVLLDVKVQRLLGDILCFLMCSVVCAGRSVAGSPNVV